jgi:membrane-bound serine protease (ClpP class)
MLRRILAPALPLVLSLATFAAPDSAKAVSLKTDSVKPSPAAAPAAKPSAVVIPIHGEVNEGLRFFVDRAVEQALAQSPRPTHIVFDVDTWGGELQAAFEISDRVSGVQNCSTVAFVKRKAISAGALIALSANRVYMAPGATIGDCAPILAGTGEDGVKYAGEKIESPLRARFRALAKRNGIPIRLAEKMVSRDGGVLEIVREGKPREFVAEADWEKLPDSLKKGATATTALADGQLLTLDDAEALDWGFSQGTFADAQALEKAKGWTESKKIEPSWSEDFARWISKFVPILFVIGMAALYLEYKNPGFGLFGVVGLLALGLALGSQYLVGLADYTELLLAGIGLLLIGIEILLFPGTIVLAGIGLVLLATSLVLSLQGFTMPDPDIPWQAAQMKHNAFVVVSTLVGGMAVSLIAMRWLVPHLPGTSGAYLRDTLQDAKSPQIDETPKTPLEGRAGSVVSTLRPVGRIVLDGTEYDAVSDGEMLPVGTSVIVIATRPGELVVRRAPDPENAA